MFFQGHPEYEEDTLLKEYIRDVRRFLKGEREAYPNLPANYFGAKISADLSQFQERALTCREESILADFPLKERLLKPINTWRKSGARIYRNWLRHLAEVQ